MTTPTGFKLKTETHDQYVIITEVHQLTPDPEATKAASMAPLMQVEEAQQLQAKARQRGQLIQGAGVAARRAKEADRQAGIEAKKPVKDLENPQHKELSAAAFQNPVLMKKLKSDYDGYERERKDKLSAARLMNSELIALDKVKQQRHREIKLQNPVYINPGQGWLIDRGTPIAGYIAEHEAEGCTIPGCHAILEDVELEAHTVVDDAGEDVEVQSVLVPEGLTVEALMQAWMTKGEREAVTVGGEIVEDYRGLKYWCKTDGKWSNITIAKLAEFPAEFEILDADLSDEQRVEIGTQAEVERVAALTPEQVDAEFNAAKSGIAAQAQAMENELKFDGKDTAPAQVWYDEQLTVLQTKYGVTA